MRTLIGGVCYDIGWFHTGVWLGLGAAVPIAMAYLQQQNSLGDIWTTIMEMLIVVLVWQCPCSALQCVDCCLM